MRNNFISRLLFLATIVLCGLSSCTVDVKEDVVFNPGETALHHIADAHAFHLFGDYYVPLPAMMFYSPNEGGFTFLPSSASFHIGHHGNGEVAIDRYVLQHGVVRRIKDKNFPMGTVNIEWPHGHGHHDDHGAGDHGEKHNDHKGHDHDDHSGHDHGAHDNHDHPHDKLATNDQLSMKEKLTKELEEHDAVRALYKGKAYDLEDRSTLDNGMAGGPGFTSYYDFSITKNVFTMLLVVFILGFVFLRVAKAYKTRDGEAPKGLQGFMEPLFVFIQDEVAKPMIGDKHYQRFMPFLMAAFFFILGLNLIGQIPFFPGSANASGTISITIALALFTFLITNLNGNRDYWGHILWMPGIPAWVKIIITPVEVMGVFLKPIVLFIRLFANISAGHIVIVAFVGLIFVLGESGKNVMGAGVGAVAATLLTLFMMAIELLVAVLQAYIFTILSASYIGAAVEEHHHEEAHH